MTVILESLNELAGSDRNEVVIPSYTCFSVASAVVRAGLKIKLCDVEPSTLDFDFDRLKDVDFTRVLAIVGCNLFCVLCNWSELSRMAKENGVFLIDDAAQSFGVSDGGRLSGMMGDVGFFSFGRGKSLTTYSGGIAVTNDGAIGHEIERRVSDLDRPSQGHDVLIAARMAMYGLFLSPNLYWIPKSLPFTGLGETVFDPDFRLARLGEFQGRIGRVVLAKFGMINSTRLRNSQMLIERLSIIDGLEFPGYTPRRDIPYLRLPVLMRSRAIRDSAVDLLTRKGLGASSMYPSPINEIAGIADYLERTGGDYPGAREISARLITLPTHPYVTEEDMARIVETFRDLEHRE